MGRVLILSKKVVYTIVVLCLFVVGCSRNVDMQAVSNVDYSLYDEIIKNVDKEPFNEIHWLTSVESGGVIVFYDTKYKDVDGDGIDELFVLRQYINQNPVGIANDYYSSLDSFNKLAIQQCFVSEAYRIVNNKVEELIIDNEPVGTRAFDGGHFGLYYFLLSDGRIAKFGRSYWEEHFMIYNNLNLETTLAYIGDMDTAEWSWEINGKRVQKPEAVKVLREISFLK